MALKLIATYSKRLGLPGYSSHQFSVCVETEINSMNDVAGESSRLYQTLQESVDEEIQRTGFVPDHGYGTNETNGTPSRQALTRGSNGHGSSEAWQCSDKQRELILKLVDEHQLDKNQVDNVSREMFGTGVRELNKLQASGLIDRLLEDHGGSRPPARRPRRPYANGGAR